ncbi:MAG: hypothetical protein H7A45_13880 [Verrucomicrobiales bacterium]|nr:hypothetical protein [Verrucomicrobiales bacterium]
MRISRPSLLAWLCVAVVLGVGARFYFSSDRALRGAARDRRALALEILGRRLAACCSGGEVLVIGNPFVLLPDQPAEIRTFEQAAVEGLLAGAGSALKFGGIAHPALDPRAAANPAAYPLPPDLRTPLSAMTTRDAWDRLRQEHPTSTLWVSLIGLPAGVGNLEVWRSPEPRFALLFPDLRLLGGSGSVKAAFTSGKLVAIVLNRPGAPPESADAGGDQQDEFDRRYLLVTPENFEEMYRRYPAAF